MAYNTLEHELKPNNINSSIVSKRNNRLLRLLRLQPAIISLVATLFSTVFWLIPLIFICPLILWDLIGLARARNRFLTIPFEVNLLLELAFFGSFIYLVYAYFSGIAMVDVSESGISGYYGNVVIGATAFLLVLMVSAVYIYLNIRAYPAHRRYKRDCRKIKPIIAFTETGNPIAVFPPPPEAELQRLSIDSLQEVHEQPYRL